MLELLGGLQWIDPMTFFGEYSILVLAASIFSIIAFLVSAIFVKLYYKKVFEIGEVPKGWRIFFFGLLLTCGYQILKIPYTYTWIYGNILVGIFLVYQAFAVGILAYGLYLMKKEAKS